MAFLRLANAFLVLHLISVCMNPVHVYADCPPPTSPPVKPPTQPPSVKPPTSPPPVKPPTLPPVKPPTQPPVKPPTSSPPVKPPTQPPVKPPMPPPTSPPMEPPTPLPVDPPPTNGVAIQGAVFCRSVCNYRDKYNKVTRTALQGAVVKLVCNSNSKKDSFMRKAETDESGNFTLKTSKLKAGGAKNCRLFLVRSRDRECNVPTTLNDGSAGATLILAVQGNKLKGYSVFNVGPFAFEPAKIRTCYD